MVNEIVAAILSFIIPGLGQALTGRYKRAIIFFVIAVLLGIIASVIIQLWIMRIVDLLFALFAAYDAYQMARIRRRY